MFQCGAGRGAGQSSRSPPRPAPASPPVLPHHTRSPHKSLSPRRPPAKPTSSSIYYYSDTLRRRGMVEPGGGGDSGRESVLESDSGVSSGRSSESTPQHPALLTGRRPRHALGTALQPVILPDRINTQIVVRNTGRKEPIVKL